MPYKQPKHTPLHNHGASEPLTILATLGAKATVGKVAAKTAAKGVAKATAKAAAKKAAAKATAKASAKATTKKAATKAAEVSAKKGLEGATKIASKGVTKMTAKSTQPTIKTLSKTAQKSVDKLGKKATKQALRQQKIGQLKGNIAGQYSKFVGKATGKGGFLENTATGKILSGNTQALTQADKVELGRKAFSGGQQVVGKIQEKQSSKPVTDASSFTSSADTKTVTNPQGQQEVEVAGYSNPQGPSAYFNPKTGPSMRCGLKYDNVGPSMTKPVKNISKTTSGDIKTNPTILQSLDKKNIKKVKKEGASFKSLEAKNTPANKNKRSKIQQVGDYARGFDATVNIGGFRFNVGQMVDLGLRAGSAIDKKVKAKKALKQQEKSYENQKQSAARAKENKQMARIAKELKTENLKG